MNKLSKSEEEELINKLKKRFEMNISRHKGINWDDIEARLLNNADKVFILSQMEKTGGEPDVVLYEKGEYIFFDCSTESPIERRNVCYDKEALESRKNFKPKDNAMDMAKKIGIEILNEEKYRYLQTLGEFDLKTSSWINTPSEIRNLGGALFCDRRYDKVFVYHNGAESYYGVRGFRGSLRL